MSYAKKYYRKGFGLCLMRTSDVKCTEIQLPEKPEEKLPLIIHTVTYPDKARFDEAIQEMEEVDEDMFNCYMLHFIGRVDVDIKAPMSEKQIKQHLDSMQQFTSRLPRI